MSIICAYLVSCKNDFCKFPPPVQPNICHGRKFWFWSHSVEVVLLFIHGHILVLLPSSSMTLVHIFAALVVDLQAKMENWKIRDFTSTIQNLAMGVGNSFTVVFYKLTHKNYSLIQLVWKHWLHSYSIFIIIIIITIMIVTNCPVQNGALVGYIMHHIVEWLQSQLRWQIAAHGQPFGLPLKPQITPSSS